MSDSYSQMTDRQLMDLFSIKASLVWTDEVAAIRNELVERGYLYDPRYRDFLTCEQWNKRHGDWNPIDCEDGNGNPIETGDDLD